WASFIVDAVHYTATGSRTACDSGPALRAPADATCRDRETILHQHSIRTIGRRANIDFRLDVCSVGVSLGDVRSELVNLGGVHEIDCRAAESAAGHARADTVRRLVRELNHEVQFFTANFVIVAQALVRLRH